MESISTVRKIPLYPHLIMLLLLKIEKNIKEKHKIRLLTLAMSGIDKSSGFLKEKLLENVVKHYNTVREPATPRKEWIVLKKSNVKLWEKKVQKAMKKKGIHHLIGEKNGLRTLPSRREPLAFGCGQPRCRRRRISALQTL